MCACPSPQKLAMTKLQAEIEKCEKIVLELEKMTHKTLENGKVNSRLQQTPIAIIGMSSIFAQSRNLQEFWENIIRKKDCITDVPSSRWNVEDYYDPDPQAPDKTYCKRGGFIPDLDFDPLEYGLPPNQLEVTDISQLLSLVIAKQAMEDAGYGESKDFNRERTGVVLGVALARQLTVPLGSRLQYPIWKKVLKSSGLSDEDTQKIIEKIKSAYVDWEPNAFPGMLANVIAGRIANRFNFGGMNCVVDAACASSLGALSMAVNELVDHRADMMLTGGVDTDNSIVAYMCFSKTPAVSKSENVKPFDANSDGMMLGEGVGMLVLKRLEDAERDGDKIYAVIKGIGTSSDGRHKSIYAPRPEGQVRALQRAYQEAGFPPTSVGLVEAHGTGTTAGDPAEFKALKTVFGGKHSGKQPIALGSVKSQIGHTKAAAGAASLIKTALSLHHKILPPTINVTQPNPKLEIESSPFYLNTETRPWIRAQAAPPRRAGVSSFGFGGTNYHIVLEEYESEPTSAYRLHNIPQVLLLHASTPEQLLTRCETVLRQLKSETAQQAYQALVDESKSLEIPSDAARLGFTADSLAQACNKLKIGIDWLKNQPQSPAWEHPQGLFYRRAALDLEGKVVALFSGQGSQYLEMGRELAINFPELQRVYAQMDSLLSKEGLQPLSDVVFPPPVFDTAHKQAQEERLQRTEYAQPAIGVFSVGLYKLLQQAGFKPDFVAGHSFGELTALWAAEVLSDEDYWSLVKARGQAMATPDDAEWEAGTMMAVKGDVTRVEELVKPFPQITIANFNSPQQLVLAGAKSEIAKVQTRLQAQGYSVVLLPVSAAFHTPLVARAQKPFAQAVERVTFCEPKTPLYSNTTGKRYPENPQAIQKILKEQIINQVLFKQEIESIYADGGRCFVEFGPRNLLTNLVKDILGDRPHLAVALNASRSQDSDAQLREAVVQLRVAGLPLKNLDPYQREQKLPQPQKKPALNIRLSSVNYVSEKTKRKFEKALNDGHQLRNGHQKTKLEELQLSTPRAASTLSRSQTGNVADAIAPQSEPLENPSTSSTSMVNSMNGSQVKSASSQSQKMSQPNRQSKPELPLNYQRVLDSLEYIFKQFNQYQREALQVHSQYLNYQLESAKAFCQLMQHQSLWLANHQSAHQSPKIEPAVLESSERSMMQFHEHQADTRRIHEQYLNHQMEYAKHFFQLTQQSYSFLLDGNHQAVPDQEVTDSGEQEQSASSLAVARVADFPITVDSEQLREPPVPETPVAAQSNGSVVQMADLPTAADTEQLREPPVPEGPATEPVEPSGTGEQATPSTAASPVSLTLDPTTLSHTLLEVVSDKTGYPVEMLELEMDMEADLGIDSIKRVEILGGLQEQIPNLPQPNFEELAELRTLGQIINYMQTFSAASQLAESKSESPSPNVDEVQAPIAENGTKTHLTAEGDGAVPSTVDLANLRQALLEVVSQKTGYPVGMLDLGMDLETELGIDLVKRVEILEGLQAQLPGLPKLGLEALSNPDLRTFGQILESLYASMTATEKKTPASLSVSNPV